MATITKTKRIMQILGLGLLLVVFPVGSWYFLNEGFTYQKQISEELKEKLGRLPVFQLISSDERQIGNDELQGKVVVISFLSLNHAAQSQPYFNELYKIQNQFDKKEAILFLTFTKATSLAELKEYVQSLNIRVNKQWVFLTEEETIMNQLMASISFPETEIRTFEENATVLLLDMDSNIRHFYNIKNRPEISKLIAHIARLMPREGRGKAVVKREKEK